MGLIRETLVHEYDTNKEDNGYLLSQIAQAYDDGDGSDVGAVLNVPDQIKSLTGDALLRAAQMYLDTGKYVKVTLMPAAGGR